MNDRASLIVFSGLPGVGKSSLAKETARVLQIPLLSVDPIERAMLRAGIEAEQPVGLAAYGVVQAVVDDLLALGQGAVVDAVNAVEEARSAWRGLAQKHHASLRFIECICSNETLHRRRIEKRDHPLQEIRTIRWEDVERRKQAFHPWSDERLVIDTFNPVSELIEQVVHYVRSDP